MLPAVPLASVNATRPAPAAAVPWQTPGDITDAPVARARRLAAAPATTRHNDTPPGQLVSSTLLDVPLRLVNQRTKTLLSCTAAAKGGRVDTWADDDGSGRQRWTLERAACGEYTVRVSDAAGKPSAYLSVHASEPVVDLWHRDDESGRQRWKLLRDPATGKYLVWVAGGRADARAYLTSDDDDDGDGLAGALKLTTLKAGQAPSKRQLWALRRVPAECDAPGTCDNPANPDNPDNAPAKPSGGGGGGGGGGSADRVPDRAASALLRIMGLSRPMVDTVLQLISLPENGHPWWWRNYGYVEFLGDGRGYTATIFGACSGTGDLAMVVQELANIDPRHPIVKFLPLLKTKRGDDVAGIEQLQTLIKAAGDDRAWQEAVWRVYVDLYWQFAADFADKKGACARRPGPVLALAISRGFVVDTAINHGANLDSFEVILRRMPNPEERDELRWLQAFIDTREKILRSGYQTLDTSGTGDRCRLWGQLLRDRNFALSRPLTAYRGYWGSYTLT
jgi:hypothetical protein